MDKLAYTITYLHAWSRGLDDRESGQPNALTAELIADRQKWMSPERLAAHVNGYTDGYNRQPIKPQSLA